MLWEPTSHVPWPSRIEAGPGFVSGLVRIKRCTASSIAGPASYLLVVCASIASTCRGVVSSVGVIWWVSDSVRRVYLMYPPTLLSFVRYMCVEQSSPGFLRQIYSLLLLLLTHVHIRTITRDYDRKHFIWIKVWHLDKISQVIYKFDRLARLANAAKCW